jgi:anionic cell wall polymer biosynthesis LytR-Cps2A-Psr (LCP) family protein
VPIDYYLVVDFVAFTTLVDEIGGIDVDVPYAINDPTYPNHYYGYDPFYVAAGLQHMDGTTALKYARSRHGTSDFERSRRQQQVLLALRDEVTSPDTLFHLLTRAPGLQVVLKDSFDTDLTLDTMVSLAMMVNEIPRDNIHSAVIDKTYVTPVTTTTGAQVLVPNYSRIQILITETLP